VTAAELAGLLGRKRASLNAAILAHRALAYAAPVALAAGLLVAAARALGLDAAGYALWASLTAAGAAAGAFAARARLLDDAGAARWLDGRLGDDELLSAALDCAKRPSAGRFDGEILESAGRLLPAASEQRPPIGPLAKRAAIAAFCLAAGSYAIFLSSYAEAAPGEAAARGGSDSAESSTRASSIAEALERGGSAASDFASSLFPEDKRMATLVERALREGRIEDLGDLLKTAGLELDSKLQSSAEETERKKLAGQKERLSEASSELALAERSAREASQAERQNREKNGKSGAPGSTGRGSAVPGSGGEDREGSGPTGRSQAPGSASSREAEGSGAEGEAGEPGGSRESAAGAQGGRGGKGFGSASGNAGDWGPIRPEAGPEQALIAASQEASPFELVLPSSSSSIPLGEIAPSSRKSAEAALAREELPLDREDFVKSYFLSLSQGKKP
jgi:hypothetical protein